MYGVQKFLLLPMAVALIGGCSSPVDAPIQAARGVSPAFARTPGADSVARDLGLGYQSNALGISPSGVIVGYAVPGLAEGDWQQHAVVWRDSVVTDLGPGSAAAISENGSVLIHVVQFIPSFHTAAVLWHNGMATELGQVNGHAIVPHGLNAADVIVGHVSTSMFGDTVHAVRWENGTVTDLGTLGGDSSTANGINASGEIVGSSLTSTGVSHAVLWQHDTIIDLTPEASGVAYAINDPGDIVGLRADSAVLWRHGSTTVLGAFVPQAIANDGTVVGYASQGGMLSGVVWRRGRLTYLAPLPGDAWSWASGINSAGQIVGMSLSLGGPGRATMWPSN